MQIIATSDAHVARNRQTDTGTHGRRSLRQALVVVVAAAGFVCFVIVVVDGSGQGGGGKAVKRAPPALQSPILPSPIPKSRHHPFLRTLL